MDLSTWIFGALTLVLLAAAAFSRRLLLLAPALGALSALVTSLFEGIELYHCACVLAAATGVFYLVLSRLPRRRLTALEAMVGKTCTVTERLDPLTGGQVEVEGNLWAARSLSAEAAYEVGTTLSVVAIEGVKLICK